MAFMAKTVSERTQPTQRQSIQENNFTAHVHARPAVDGISGVLVSDSEYPVRVAFSLLNKLLEEFLMKVPKSSWQAQAMEIASTGSIPSKAMESFVQVTFLLHRTISLVTRTRDRPIPSCVCSKS